MGLKNIWQIGKENITIILTIIPILGILMQSVVLYHFGIMAFFSFGHIFVDTFYMIQILFLWIITFSYRLNPFIKEKYEWKNLFWYSLISGIIILASIGINSALLMGITVINFILGIMLNINYLLKDTNAKRSFGYIMILSTFIINIVYFNYYLFDGIYDKESNLKVLYLNDRYVLLEDKTIIPNNDRIFYLSGSTINIPFLSKDVKK